MKSQLVGSLKQAKNRVSD